MPSIEINCSGCQLYLGTIHKAKLRKNISYLCNKCEIKRYNTTNSSSGKSSGDKDFPKDFFGDIFNDCFREK